MITLTFSYDSVQTQRAVSDVKELLKLDQSLTGTGSTSIIITRGNNGKQELMKLKGLGKHLWRDIDAQKYIDQLREEWE
jgi:hypothetical protein